MRNFTYHGRIYVELYGTDALTKVQVTTINYDKSITNKQMTVTTSQFERALDGDLGTMQAIEWAYEDLATSGRI